MRKTVFDVILDDFGFADIRMRGFCHCLGNRRHPKCCACGNNLEL